MASNPRSVVFKSGMEEGKKVAVHEILSFIQKRFIDDDDRPEKGSPEYDYHLKLAKEVAEFTRSLDVTK